MTDQRQAPTPAGQAVLDAADRQRAPFVDSAALLRQIENYAISAQYGDRASRRQAAIMAGAFSILAIEAIDEEMKG